MDDFTQTEKEARVLDRLHGIASDAQELFSPVRPDDLLDLNSVARSSLEELTSQLQNPKTSSRWKGAVNSRTSGHELVKLLHIAKENTQLMLLGSQLALLKENNFLLRSIENRLKHVDDIALGRENHFLLRSIENRLKHVDDIALGRENHFLLRSIESRLLHGGDLIRNPENPISAAPAPSAEGINIALADQPGPKIGQEYDKARPTRRDSLKKDKSLFRGSDNAQTEDTTAHETKRRREVDDDHDVADYYAVVNGLAEPYDRFLWRGSVCIPAPAGKTHGIWHPVKIKLDTGSDFNVISRRVLTSLQYRSGYDEPHFKTAITLDAAHVQQFEERVSLSFTFDMWPFTLYETFYVRDGAEIDLLIGHETISAENLLQVRQDVVNHLRWRHRSKMDRAEMEQNRKKAIEEAENERAAALRMLTPITTKFSSGLSKQSAAAPPSIIPSPSVALSSVGSTPTIPDPAALATARAEPTASGALPSRSPPAYGPSTPTAGTTGTASAASTVATYGTDTATTDTAATAAATVRPQTSHAPSTPGTDAPDAISAVTPAMLSRRATSMSAATTGMSSPTPTPTLEYPTSAPRKQVDAYYSYDDLPKYQTGNKGPAQDRRGTGR